MDKKTMFERMAILIERLNEVRAKGISRLSAEEASWVQDIKRATMNNPRLTVCSTCSGAILSAINEFVPYYQREFPAFQRELEESEVTPGVSTEPTTDPGPEKSVSARASKPRSKSKPRTRKQ